MKPGPREVPTGNLLLWEHEWYSAFHGLAFGAPAVDEIVTSCRPKRGPTLWASKPKDQRPNNFEELDRKYSANWNSKPESKKWNDVEDRIKKPKIPAELEIWEVLKNTRSPAQIVAACNRSVFWLNARATCKPYIMELSKNPDEFLAGKNYRYARSNRPSSELKRVIHFSRAMAGIMEGISAARAIDRIRMLEHGDQCQCVSCTIERHKRFDVALDELANTIRNASG